MNLIVKLAAGVALVALIAASFTSENATRVSESVGFPEKDTSKEAMIDRAIEKGNALRDQREIERATDSIHDIILLNEALEHIVKKQHEAARRERLNDAGMTND